MQNCNSCNYDVHCIQYQLPISNSYTLPARQSKKELYDEVDSTPDHFRKVPKFDSLPGG